MAAIRQVLRKLRSDRRGVTAVEYGLITAILATALVTSVNNLGANITTAFTNIGTHLTSGK